VLLLAVGALTAPDSLCAQARETQPDTLAADTVPVDSTRLRIEQQLLGLARPPGVDSTYFLPDSLMPDSLREILDRRRGAQRRGQRSGGRGESAGASSVNLSAGDSILVALKELGGYSLTEYQSAGAEFAAAERELILLGTPSSKAQLVAEGMEVSSDSLFYAEETGKLWSSESGAAFRGEDGDPVEARVLVFDLNEERGTALDATTSYSAMGSQWIVHGDLTSVDDTATWGSRLSFTSCDHEEPHYHFESNNVKIVGNLLVARPAKLYFADVPVAWLPFIVNNISPDRSSGLLTPTFSINDIVRTSQSYSRRVSNIGFYWAGSDYHDLTVFMDWWSGEHVALTGSTRFAWAKQFLNGQMNWREFWREGGDRQRAFDGSANWEASERTKVRFRARYTSSSQMVRQTSFNPMEAVQTIDSEGGLSHRFDFGNLTLSANRKQYLSDDRVEMTAPNLSFSLSPITFLRAAPSQARFYNNITWSGSARMRRSTSDRPEQADTAVFKASLADQRNTDAQFSSSLTMGNLSLGGSFNFKEKMILDVPVGTSQGGLLEPPQPFRDEATADATWSASLGYQQRLIGSTTLTPSLSISGQMKRSDTDPLAEDFVSAPTRMSLGVSLKTDLYGFFPGFGPFEALRHKISPGFDYSYSPEVTPTELQQDVFLASEIGAQRTLRISLNQTWEAKRKQDPDAPATPGSGGVTPGGRAPAGIEAPGAATEGEMVPDSLLALVADSMGITLDSLLADTLLVDSLLADSLQGPRSTETQQTVTLLSLRTTSISYDFEKAKARDDWLWGVTNTVITNTISSDYLRGLNITVAHDLFEDVQAGAGGGEGGAGGSTRRFAPHLSSLNFGFSLNANSLPFRLLSSLLGGGEEGAEGDAQAGQADVAQTSDENPFAPSLTDEASIIPSGGDPAPRRRSGSGRGGGRGWNANLRFSMQRPRDENLPSNQMLQGSLNFSLTDHWDASWRTSYDLVEGSFNDHYITLTRDLHRWEAHFDFRKSATGNWQFRFEVALLDQDDLHFDYSQRSYQSTSGGVRF
jgi:hypothetical protein